VLIALRIACSSLAHRELHDTRSWNWSKACSCLFEAGSPSSGAVGEHPPSANISELLSAFQELHSFALQVVAGVLTKYVNLAKGWRDRLFVMSGDKLYYFKVRASLALHLLASLTPGAHASCSSAQPRHHSALNAHAGFVSAQLTSAVRAADRQARGQCASGARLLRPAVRAHDAHRRASVHAAEEPRQQAWVRAAPAGPRLQPHTACAPPRFAIPAHATNMVDLQCSSARSNIVSQPFRASRDGGRGAATARRGSRRASTT
jgi:hypothetical protein